MTRSSSGLWSMFPATLDVHHQLDLIKMVENEWSDTDLLAERCEVCKLTPRGVSLSSEAEREIDCQRNWSWVCTCSVGWC